MQGAWPVIVNTGGARSGKSYGTMQILCYWAVNNPNTRISVVSRSLPHVKKGVFRDFQQLLKAGLIYYGDMRWTDFTFHFSNGSYIEFFGLEDPDKAHGPGRDILFINEANFVPKSVYDQLAMRTTGKILLDLNPSEFNSWVYEVAENPTNKNIHSTYKDNIGNLSAQQVAHIESYQSLPDQFLWQVYGLGLRGATEETIYPGIQYCDQLPGKGDIFFGLDFGFTNPSAFVRIEYYEGAYYIEELIYQSGLTKPELNEKIKSFNTGYGVIYADAAEPDSIEELYRMGCNIKPAIKDVWAGIVFLKGCKLFIKRDSRNAIKEFQSYKWKKDKNDNVLEEPIKENDHIPDAVRYAIYTQHKKPVRQWLTL